MFFNKLRTAIAVVLLVGFLATGTTILTCRTATGQDDKKATAGKPMAPAAKQAHEKEREPFTAWGKEVDGLQAGLGFRPGEPRAYHYGETVTLVVRVRNVGKKAVQFEYLKQFFDENPPIVTDAEGKTVPQVRLAVMGFHVPVEVSLAPGQEIQLESRLGGASGVRYELKPASEREKGSTGKFPPLYVGTGKVSVQYERLFGNTSAGRIKVDPDLLDLATGKLELEIKPGPPTATEKK